ncbi:unnamed protein product [Nyctereutes procyonoides]|uniref:(raccoon dog) hypothetical protein n=1 Tax=Nyctereutes procyonoides TaxID=34880 RepID=A0A811YKZ6_NYCPR|nr:unnamed protein product [Nyctereutes procyonoides]
MSVMSNNRRAIVAMNGKNCVTITDERCYLAGLTTNVQTVAQHLKFQLNLYELKEGRQIKPYTLMSMPVIMGLDLKTKPLICSLYLICCPMVTDNISLWGPDVNPEHLFESISQTMLNTADQDALSGMGVIVHIIEKDKITTRTLRARMD